MFEGNTLATLNIHGAFVENQSNRFSYVFCIYSIPSTYFSIPLSMQKYHTLSITVTLRWVLKSVSLVSLPILFFIVKICLGWQISCHSLCFIINLFFSLKNNSWDFKWSCFDSVDLFGENVFINTKLSIHKHSIFLHLFRFSVSSSVSCDKLCPAENLSFSSRLSHMMA